MATWSMSPLPIRSIIRGDTDAQSVPCAQAFWSFEVLTAELDALGFSKEELRRIMARGYEAWDLRGLTMNERTVRLHERDTLVSQLLAT